VVATSLDIFVVLCFIVINILILMVRGRVISGGAFVIHRT